MSEPASGKARKTRSRAACSSCKGTKQRCDGPNTSCTRCRRCELYGLVCQYPASAGPLYSVPQAHRAPDQPVASSSKSTQPESSTEGLEQKLYEISSRLHSIESALHLRRFASPLDPASPADVEMDLEQELDQIRSIKHEFEHEPDHQSQKFDSRLGSSTPQTGNGDRSNPLQEVHETIERVLGGDDTNSNMKGRLATNDSEYGIPDAIRRGLLNEAEVQGLFDFFFAQLHPWIMMLSLTDDTDAMVVRKRSPLLFHTILLLSTAYSPTPSNLHMTLSTYINNLLAPTILQPCPETLTMDFLAAIDLLLIHKPIQTIPPGEESQMMLKTKVNGLASWMLQGILARTAERLDLSACTTKFLRAHQVFLSTGIPIPSKITSDLRLYYWLLSNDVHGNVQNGRKCNMHIAPSTLSTIRIFYQLRLQPCDTRLAAGVELFEVARPILRTDSFERTRRIGRVELEKYNAGMATWEEHWRPILTRELTVDPLAMSVICFGYFINVTFYASAATASKGAMHDAANGVNDWEWDCLNRSVRAAEALIFNLSEESRVKGAWRAVQWEEAARVDGYRRLTPDDFITDSHRYAMDAITCIMYIFPLIFMVKLFNEGMLTADLVVLHSPAQQPNFNSTNKLPRLLELGSAYLEGVASNLYHPAKQQAVVVRALLEAGLRGRPPVAQLPRHAAVVLSPAPELLFSPQPSTELSHKGHDWSPTALSTIERGRDRSQQLNQEENNIALREQRYQYGLQMENNNLNLVNGTLPNPALEAVLDGVDFSVFGETAAFWEYSFAS